MSYFKVLMYGSSFGVISCLLFLYYHGRKKSDSSSGLVDKDYAVCSAPRGSNEDGNILSKRDAHLLTNLLVTESAGNEKMLQQVLTTIGNRAAFTQNQNVLREVGCLSRLTVLVKSYSLSLISEDHIDMGTLQSLLCAVNNLAMNEANQKELQGCISALTLIVSWHSVTNSAVTLAALQALTNMAVTSSYHSMYSENMHIIAQLALSSTPTSDVRLQAMKLLVNLTASREMAFRLLAVENPSGFVRALDEVNNLTLTLRTLSVLVNLHTSIGGFRDANLGANLSSVVDGRPEIPNNQTDDGSDVCSSHDCKPTSLHSPEYRRNLNLKLDRILRCGDPDVRALALRLVSQLPAITCPIITVSDE